MAEALAVPPAVALLARLATELDPSIVNTVLAKAVELAGIVAKTVTTVADILLKSVVSLAEIAVKGITKLASIFTTAVVEIVRSGERVLLGIAQLVGSGLGMSLGQRSLAYQ